MAYTTIDDPTIYFNTKLYTGNGSDGNAITGVNFQPDWVWIKDRDNVRNNILNDSVRGAPKNLFSNTTGAESSDSTTLVSFNSDGFTLNNGTKVNGSSINFVSWNWLAGGASPAITYTVKVVSDSGNKYRFNDFGTSAVTLDLQEGGTYTFDQSDSSNSGHPLRFYTASDKSGGEYTTGVTTTGTPGNAGAKTVITVAASSPTLYYQCSVHAGMGGQANTNSTFGSSNFSGSIQSTVSANTTAGFSIVSWSADGGNTSTAGHSLGITPQIIIYKSRGSGAWYVWLNQIIDSSNDYLLLNSTNAKADIDTSTYGTPSSTTISNFGFTSGENMIAYCFAEKKGYSKFGKFIGNNNADGAFVYLGFRPAWVMIKSSATGGSNYDWVIFDNKRNTFNVSDNTLDANQSNAEVTSGRNEVDFLSNGFKCRESYADVNSSTTYIYMAFAESPFVNSNGVPNNAR